MVAPQGDQQAHQHHHRSTLKQKNKSFKSRHASKGSIKTAAKGRQESATSASASSRIGLHKQSPLSAQNAAGSAQARRNHAKQMQLQKRQALVDANRIFKPDTGLAAKAGEARGGGAPRIVVVCSLTDDVDSWAAAEALERHGEDGGVRIVAERGFADAKASGAPFTELDLTRHRARLQLHPVPFGALYTLLDVCKAADFVMLVLSSETSVEADSWGELAMRTLQAQGMPTAVATCLNLPTQVKRANEVRKSLLSFTRYFAPDVEKVYSLTDNNERGALLRTMACSTPKRLAWRDYRAWLVSEEAQFSQEDGQAEQGTLKVTGWVRGATLSANRLVHLPDFGDFAVDRITDASVRAKRKTKKEDRAAPEMEMTSVEDEAASQGAATLEQRGDADVADELVSENEVDDMQNEQTWPTEEEMANGASNGHADESELPPALPGTTPLKITKDRQKHKYGANWITEEDEDDDEEDEEDAMDSDEGMHEDGDDAMRVEGEGSIDDDIGNDENDDEYDELMEEQELQAYKERLATEKKRAKDEEVERAFPDEVDTPMDIPARVRFQRYRGLQSIRTSSWDPYEDLPRDYARIFQFDNYTKTRRRVEASAMEEGVAPGTRVTLWIRDVPRAAAERAGAVLAPSQANDEPSARMPFVVFGLLRHEHKKSVLNFTIARNTEYDATIKSKDTLVLCLGPRRLRVQPIFSQHDPANDGRRGTNNVHKMERYLHGVGSQGYVAVGTVVGPITFGGANVPAVLLRERILDGESGYDDRGVGATQMPHLVGTGTLLDADPTRIVAKRIVLTGHPYKVHKRTSTVRFMFFNPEDVRYFAPLELRTKLGRIGHISESLGTHGYFKAHFDGKVPLSQLDTVGMTLYKRTFPKFAESFTQSRLEMPLATIAEQDEADEPIA